MSEAAKLVVAQTLAVYYAAKANGDEAKAKQAIEDLRSRMDRIPGVAEIVASERQRLQAVAGKNLSRRCHASAVQLEALTLASGDLA